MSDSETRTTALDKKTAAIETAAELAHSLDENTEELSRVRRRYRLTMALIILVGITMLSVARINYDGHLRRCETSNVLREEVEKKFHSIADSLVRNGLAEEPGGEELIEILYDEIPRNDCSDIDWLGR